METRSKKSSSKREPLKKKNEIENKTFTKENFVKKSQRRPQGLCMNKNATFYSLINKMKWAKIPLVRLIPNKKDLREVMTP